MKDHYIICGYGHVGLELIIQLRQKNERFVVVENVESRIERLVEEGIPVIKGDATQEGVLKRAGIEYAKGLFATLDDSTNVVVVVTAKMLNPDFLVVSEVEGPINSDKMRRVGADAVINCHEMGARVMVKETRRVVLCPVCGIEVDPDEVEHKMELDGETYYFCGPECYEAFVKNPKRFLDIKRTVDSTGD
jgi:voltage-gated potassium channel